MIDHLCGKLVRRDQGGIVVRAGDIGFYLEVPAGAYGDTPLGSQLEVPTILVFREHGASLFGFSNSTEREFFSLLTTISGIGPKSALGILGHTSPSQLADAIIREDVSALIKVKGIGKKGARRIIVELAEKIRILSSASYRDPKDIEAPKVEGPLEDAADVLLSLGCTSDEAQTALKLALQRLDSQDEIDTDLLVMYALKELGGQ